MTDIKIKNTKPRLYTANGIALQPGLNTMSEENAKIFLSHPHIKIKVERGIIEVDEKVLKTIHADIPVAAKGDKQKAGNTTGTVNYDEMTAADLVDLIEASEDADLISSFTTHKFKTVREASEARLEALTA